MPKTKSAKSRSNSKIKPKVKPKVKSKSVLKSKVQKKRFYSNARFWAVISVTGVISILIVIMTIVTKTTGQQHEEAVSEYGEIWEKYATAQNSLGYQFGVLLSEIGFSTDSSTKYNLDSDTQRELSKECTKKLGVYDEVFDNPYVTRDVEIAKKSTGDIDIAIKSLQEYINKINQAIESVENCREVGEAKKRRWTRL